MKIFQVVNTFGLGDAISNYAVAIKNLLASLGYDSDIYSEAELNETSGTEIKYIHPVPDFNEEDIMIFHLSTCVSMRRDLYTAKCRKIAVYHNITPREFFYEYSSFFARICFEALMDIRALENTFDHCIADSGFNRDDLIGYGYTCPITVLPIIVPYDDYDREPNKALIDKYNDGRTNIFFIGRVAPNKKFEDVIAAFSCYKKHYDPGARLFLAGSEHQLLRSYSSRLNDYVKMNGFEDIIFTGKIPFDEVLAYYKIADIFLCMSEHEGFCVPLLEAMYFDVPIVAYDSSAIPETLGGAGFLLHEKDPLLTAGVIHRIMSDTELRDKLIQGQRKRLSYYSYENTTRMFSKFLESLLGEIV